MVNRLKELAAFVRFLLPADVGQLLLLIGSYLLYASLRMAWWPAHFHGTRWEAFNSQTGVSTISLTEWVMLVRALALPLVCAGAVGFYLFFWQVARPTRRLISWVILPAVGGVLAEFAGAVWLFGRRESILETGGEQFHRIVSLLPALALELGTGLQFALLGLVLVSATAWRVRRGLTSLPASATFPVQDPVGSMGSAVDHSDLRRFSWAVLALSTPIAASLSGVLAFLIWKGEGIWGAQYLLASLPPALIAFRLMAGQTRTELRSMLTPRRADILLLAAVIAILIHWIPKIVFLIEARVRWATHERDLVPPPDMWDFLHPGRWQWQIALTLVAALLSEIAWRGYALPRFVARFGLYRGIVLVGLLWGTLNGRTVWNWAGADLGVILGIADASLRGIVFSFPLAWLTLKSRSIVPAALAVGLGSVLHSIQWTEPVRLSGALASESVHVSLWGLLGFILFRYFGLPEQNGRAKEAA